MQKKIWLVTTVFIFSHGLAHAADRSAQPAQAGKTTLSAEISSEREPDDFSDILNTKYKFEVAHAFESGIYINGSFELEEPAEDKPDSKNLEGNLGYKHALVDPLSIAGSFGIGERLTEDNDFPYYVFRIGLDLALDDRLSWNIATFRYRNAFDTENDYETPRWSTKLTLRLDNHNAIYGEIYRNLDEEWEPTATGITGGYAFSF
jgi:hypothetical protein